MNNYKNFFVLIIGVICMLAACQRGKDTVTSSSGERQDQQNIVAECETLDDMEPEVEMGYVESGWYPKSEIAEGQNVYKGFSEWKTDTSRRVVLENTSPSGDWYRIDEYCFNGLNNIAELHSDLRTFYGDVQAVRLWEYFSDGSVQNSTTELFDLNTNKPIDPGSVNFMDNPPLVTTDYEALRVQLGLPAL